MKANKFLVQAALTDLSFSEQYGLANFWEKVEKSKITQFKLKVSMGGMTAEVRSSEAPQAYPKLVEPSEDTMLRKTEAPPKEQSELLKPSLP